MTRRQGVIAALATVAGALAGQQVEKPKPSGGTGTVTSDFGTTGNLTSASTLLDSHTHLLLEMVDEADKQLWGIDSIIVRYGKRSVKLTAKDIMDALEGK